MESADLTSAESRGTDELAPVGERDHVLGAAEPQLTLVEYGDFGCPFCFAANRPVMSLLERYDTLRLVYADALEEEGDGRRAAFVRTQVQLARVPEYDPLWVRTRHHEREKLGGRWALELPELPHRRGLPLAQVGEDQPQVLRYRVAEQLDPAAERLNEFERSITRSA